MKQSLLLPAVLLVLFYTAPAASLPGHLLVLKVVQINVPGENYHYASLFKVEFDGSVNQYWNYTYDQQHNLNWDNLFAIDSQDQLVYLGAKDQLLALRLTTGEVVIKRPFKQNFFNYYYIAKEKAIYGMCDGLPIYWCRVKLGTSQPQLEKLYKVPGSDNDYPARLRGFYIDKEAQSMWYLTGLNQKHVRGVNYTTGKEFFITNSTYTDFCIVHDDILNATLSTSIDEKDPTYMFLAQLFWWPRNESILLKLPPDLTIASYFDTMCDYDPQTYTLMVLMINTTTEAQDAMPTHIVLIDVPNLSYKLHPLPGFKQWSDKYPVTAVKYVPYN